MTGRAHSTNNIKRKKKAKKENNKSSDSIAILYNNINFGREKPIFEFQLGHYWLWEHSQRVLLFNLQYLHL